LPVVPNTSYTVIVGTGGASSGLRSDAGGNGAVRINYLPVP
jgi:hypothetical protein